MIFAYFKLANHLSWQIDILGKLTSSQKSDVRTRFVKNDMVLDSLKSFLFERFLLRSVKLLFRNRSQSAEYCNYNAFKNFIKLQ